MTVNDPEVRENRNPMPFSVKVDKINSSPQPLSAQNACKTHNRQ